MPSTIAARDTSVEQEAFVKLLHRLESISLREKLLSACEVYYNEAQDEHPWESVQGSIEARDFEPLQRLTRELCAEAITRDMMQMIRTGARGRLGAHMYRALR